MNPAPVARPPRVVLSEGASSRAVGDADRFAIMATLLQGGDAVTSVRRGARPAPDGVRAPIVVLGRFEGAPPQEAGQQRPQSPTDACPSSSAASTVSSRRRSPPSSKTCTGRRAPESPARGNRGSRSSTTRRCTNCMQCLSFCLFDVYGVSADQQIQVQNQSNCKTDCPACSRVCPEVAIMFPKYRHGPINGEEVTRGRHPPRGDEGRHLGAARRRHLFDAARPQRQGQVALLEGTRRRPRAEGASELPGHAEDGRSISRPKCWRRCPRRTRSWRRPKRRMRRRPPSGAAGARTRAPRHDGVAVRKARADARPSRAWSAKFVYNFGVRASARSSCTSGGGSAARTSRRSCSSRSSRAASCGARAAGWTSRRPQKLSLDELQSIGDAKATATPTSASSAASRSCIRSCSISSRRIPTATSRSSPTASSSPTRSPASSRGSATSRRSSASRARRSSATSAAAGCKCSQDAGGPRGLPRHRLLIGVATSVCQTNIELVSEPWLRRLIAMGVHYVWFHTYRVVGPNPYPQLALQPEQVLGGPPLHRPDARAAADRDRRCLLGRPRRGALPDGDRRQPSHRARRAHRALSGDSVRDDSSPRRPVDLRRR